MDYLELQQEWSSSQEGFCNSFVKRQVSKNHFWKHFLSVCNDQRTPLLQRFPSSDSASCFFPFCPSWLMAHRLTKFGAQGSMSPYLRYPRLSIEWIAGYSKTCGMLVSKACEITVTELDFERNLACYPQQLYWKKEPWSQRPAVHASLIHP